MELTNRIILITGALGGLGRATVEQITKDNYFVFATDKDKEVLNHYKNRPMVCPLIMDITDKNSIENAFEKINSQTTELDAIINMAGKLIVGSVVEVSTDEVKRIMDVNLLGVYRVNKKFAPMLSNRTGKVIVISSETGKQTAAPFNGIYAMSKYALEAYSDALRRELIFLNIKVVKIQPGAFKTSMTKQVEDLFDNAENKSVLFKYNILKGKKYLPNVYKKANDPKVLAKKILRILKDPNPKTAYSFKQDIPRTLLELLPVKWADKLIKKILS